MTSYDLKGKKDEDDGSFSQETNVNLALSLSCCSVVS